MIFDATSGAGPPWEKSLPTARNHSFQPLEARPGFVADGVIWGMLACWRIGLEEKDSPEKAGPTTAMILESPASLFAGATALSLSPWVSWASRLRVTGRSPLSLACLMARLAPFS